MPTTKKVIANKKIVNKKVEKKEQKLKQNTIKKDKEDKDIDIIKTLLKQQNIENKEPDYREVMKNYNPKQNISSPILTEYEKTSIIGKRATQIANGSPIFIERKANMKEEDIAELELYNKKIPFGVERKIGSKTEYWRLKDMIIN